MKTKLIMNNKYHLYIILTLLLSISCQKFGHHLALETGTLTNKTASGAQVDAMVIDVGESGLTEHGWCIATEPEATVSNTKINNGSKSQYGVYNNEITGLDPASKYYIRPYITNGSQTVYGEQLELQTEALQFTINTPVANTIWAKGKTFAINWNANVNDKINIDLYKNGTLVKNLAQEIENTGSYNWSITNELENGEDYKIIITSSENEIIKAQTALFSIYDNAPPGVSTGEVRDISYFTAQIGGTLLHFGTEESVLQHGHCWSKNENPTIDANKTELGAKSSLESFTSDLSELKDNTTYYVRAYAVSEEGVAYGSQQEFITFKTEAPKISLPIINNISYTTANCQAEVEEQGTHDMVSRGICWSKMENPTINDDKIEENSGIGSFTKSISDIDWNTKYNVRAFAINEVDTAYSEQVSFTTLEVILPTVVTSEVTNISYTSATCGGEVTSEGTHDVTSRGVCWSTSENPTIDNYKCINEKGVSLFTNDMLGLNGSTSYYIRAYAETTIGVTYGEQVICKTLTYGSVVDIDENIYKTVVIGNQVWMAENLRVTRYNDGTEIALITGNTDWMTSYIPAYCWYDNNETLYKTIYGALYNRSVINKSISEKISVCPIGWHVPSSSEWSELVTYLGGELIAGGKMKEYGITHWSWDDLATTNSSGFTALPGGCRDDDGSFSSIGNICFFMIQDESLTFYITTDVPWVSSNSHYRKKGNSIRCIKD